MDQFKFLIKTMFIEDWGVNGFSNTVEEGREKRKIKSILMMIIFMMSLCCYLIITYSVLLRQKLEVSNNEDVLLKISNIIVSMAICILTMYKVDNGFFNTKNNSMLITLPISVEKAVLSKIGSLLIVNYVLVIICIIPSAIIYYYYNYNEIYGLLYGLLVFICSIVTPFLPMLIGLASGMIIKGFRGENKEKGKVIIILTVALLILMMISSMKVNNLLRVIIAEGAFITENISDYYKLAQYFADAIAKFKVLQLFKYIIIQGIAAVFLYKLLIRNFKRINNWYVRKE